MLSMGFVVLFLAVLAGCGSGGNGAGTGSVGNSGIGLSGESAIVLKGTPSPSPAGQASITLNGGALAPPCYGQIRDWEITKVRNSASPAPSPSPGDVVTADADGKAKVSWTVTVTNKGLEGDGSTPDQYLKVSGYINVTNTGSAPATIGNIALNLQEKVGGSKFKTISTDAADATHGDLFTSPLPTPSPPGVWVVRGALSDPTSTTMTSQNAAYLCLNKGSGSIVFTDPASNDEWAITPQQSIAVGQTVSLLFQATFYVNGINSITGIPAPVGENSQLRAEFIVTFGNAGARGGSGAVATSVDINGDGTIQYDEANVRSVPDRFISFTVPQVETCDDTVTLTDAMAASNGAKLTNTTFNEQDPDSTTGLFPSVNLYGGSGSAPTGYTGVPEASPFTCQATADVALATPSPSPVPPTPPYLNSDVTNTAHLDNPGTTVSILLPDGITYYVVQCCPPLHLLASATWHILSPGSTTPGGGGEPSGYTTYTQGGWGSKPSGNNPGAVLAQCFPTVYPSPNNFVQVGIPPAPGPSPSPSPSKDFYYMKFTSALAIQNYLPAGGTPDVLMQSLVNPTSSSAGSFGGQVLSVQLAVDFSKAEAKYTNGTTTIQFKKGFGGLILQNTDTPLDGRTVSEILVIANEVLGGDTSVYKVSDLNVLMTALTNSFDNGNTTAWAITHLYDPTATPTP